MKYKMRRITIFVLDVLGALTTIAGAIGILFGGIVFPPGLLQSSPFSDFTIPGLALGVIVGGSFIIAAATILASLSFLPSLVYHLWGVLSAK